MARRQRVQVAAVAGETSRRSLETVVAELDDVLDDGLARSRARRAIADADPDGPAPLRQARRNERTWLWSSECEVVRAMPRDVGAGRRSYAGQWIGVLDSPHTVLGRHQKRGGVVASPAATSSAYEPRAGGGAHFAAAYDHWRALTPAERTVLLAMHADLVVEDDGGALAVSARLRQYVLDGALDAARNLLAPDRLLCRELLTREQLGAFDLATVTPTQLAAIALRRLAHDADAATKASVTRELSHELRAARRRFRERLWTVDLNAHLEKLADPIGMPRERWPHLIPPPRLADLERDRSAETIVCAGRIEYGPLPLDTDVAKLVAMNPRPVCDVARVVADTSSWPRCDVCGRPRAA